MKSKIKIAIITVMVLLSIFSSSVFAETGKFTDIPVPPNSSGYADYTEEEAAEDEKEYEENKENALTAEDYVGKSSDYYLKSLEVEGYKLEPKFNRQNDEYTIYVKDDNIDTFNVKAEADNEKATIDGTGSVTVPSDERLINVTVTAENGNIKVYTIKVDNEANREKNYNWIIGIIIAVIIILILFILIKKSNKKGKRTRK